MTFKDLTPEQIARAAEGEKKELELLLRQLEPELRAGLTISAPWRRSLDPDDVLQVSYLETFLRISTLRDRTPSGLQAWMRRLVQNNLKDAIRALERDKRPDAKRRVTVGQSGQSARTLLGMIAADAPTAGLRASLKEQVSDLQGAILRLPASYRTVVQSVDLEERSVAEVAKELGRSQGAVHLLRSRAHDRLAELLRET
jgi:RNA polymerase sigma-70 factor (ECF subfamily)